MSDLSQPCYSMQKLSDSENLNLALEAGFYKHHQSEDIRRSHLFQGRYENIYIDDNHIPELKTLLQKATIFASDLLREKNIQAGSWFNHMPPGSVTIAHSHDDDDELLSAVYYICVPRDSGNLLIHDEKDIIEVHPEESLFVFFKPDVVHEVTENKSRENRLSIGINFGVKRTR